MKGRKVVVALADMHSGHKLGLCSPETVLDPDLDPHSPTLGKTQRYLWDCLMEDLCEIRKYAGKDPTYLFYDGDWHHGLKHFEQLMSNNPDDQIRIGVANMAPFFHWIRNLVAVRMVQGTPVHDPVGSMTSTGVSMLKELYPKIDIKMSLHGLMTLDGVGIDFTHFGPSVGGRRWLDGNIVRYNLRSMMLDDIVYGDIPPRVYLRAHRHVYRHEQIEIYGSPDLISDLFVLPSYCGLSLYAQNVITSTRLDTGILVLEIIDGEYRGYKIFKRTLDLREREVIS